MDIRGDRGSFGERGSLLGRMLRAEGGSIAEVGAVLLLVLVSLAGLAIESANWYTVRADLQHTADAAATAAAVEFIKMNPQTLPLSTSQQTEIRTAAANLGSLNGVTIDTSVPPSPQIPQICIGDSTACPGGPSSGTLISVVAKKSVNLFLTRTLTTLTSMTISATGWAQVSGSSPACVTTVKTSGGRDITVNGNVTLTAPGCTLEAASTDGNGNGNQSIKLDGGSMTLDVAGLSTEGTIKDDGVTFSTNPPTAVSQNMASGTIFDWVAAKSSVSSALSHLTSVESLSSSTSSSNHSQALNLDSNCKAGMNASKSAQCLGTYCCAWTIPAGTYGAVTTGSSTTVTFSPGTYYTISTGSGSTNTFSGGTYVFNSLTLGSNNVTTFANGTYGPITAGTGNTVTFATGTYGAIGIGSGSTVTFSGGGTTSVAGAISGAGTMTFNSGQYDINGGLSDGGGTTVFGAGMYTLGGGLSLSGSYTGSGTSFVMGAFPSLGGSAGTNNNTCTDGTNTYSAPCLVAPCPLSTSCTTSYNAVAGLLIAVPSTVATNSLTLPSNGNVSLVGVLDIPSANFTLGGNATNGKGCFALVANTFIISGNPQFSSCLSLSYSEYTLAIVQ